MQTEVTIYTTPPEIFNDIHRCWQGCPTIERVSSGRLFAGWYSGGLKEPDYNNYCLLVKSDDSGNSWSQPILVIESNFWKGIRAIDIQLWNAPDGKLWVFWTQVTGWCHATPEKYELWAMTTDNPGASQIHWSSPFFISEGFLRHKPTVLKDGRWLLCAYTRGEYYEYTESSDNGKTFHRCRAGKKIQTVFDESTILELNNGLLKLYARTQNSGFIAECQSANGGNSWSDAVNSKLVSASSRFFIGRLHSGAILRINNVSPALERRNLTAFLSLDDGKTWPHSIILDRRLHISYPDAVQAPDGQIYIVYDWNRIEEKAIFLTVLQEEDIIAGRLVSPDSYISRVLNQPPPRIVFFPR